MNNNILTYNEIKSQYPNEWILLELSTPQRQLNKSGVVLYHSQDYLELCYKGSEIAKDILTTIFYTGQRKSSHNRVNKHRLLKLAIRESYDKTKLIDHQDAMKIHARWLKS